MPWLSRGYVDGGDRASARDRVPGARVYVRVCGELGLRVIRARGCGARRRVDGSECGWLMGARACARAHL